MNPMSRKPTNLFISTCLTSHNFIPTLSFKPPSIQLNTGDKFFIHIRLSNFRSKFVLIKGSRGFMKYKNWVHILHSQKDQLYISYHLSVSEMELSLAPSISNTGMYILLQCIGSYWIWEWKYATVLFRFDIFL